MQKILRRSEVEKATGLSCSSIYRLMAAKAFPKPIKLGLSSVGWLEPDIAAWQKARIDQRDRVAA